MDEPCSALDPIATGRIEDLMQEIKDEYTIVIVTHNMQQAARVSDRTAFFTTEVNARRATPAPGCWSSSTRTEKMFSNPERRADRELRHRPLRLSMSGDAARDEPLRREFHAELDQLRLQVELMGVRVDENLERMREVPRTRRRARWPRRRSRPTTRSTP